MSQKSADLTLEWYKEQTYEGVHWGATHEEIDCYLMVFQIQTTAGIPDNEFWNWQAVHLSENDVVVSSADDDNEYTDRHKAQLDVEQWAHETWRHLLYERALIAAQEARAVALEKERAEEGLNETYIAEQLSLI